MSSKGGGRAANLALTLMMMLIVIPAAFRGFLRRDAVHVAI